MKILLLAMLTLLVACGKDSDSKGSSKNVFGSSYGVPTTVDAVVVIPGTQTSYPTIIAGGRTYQIGQGSSPQVWQQLNSMFYGQWPYPPVKQDSLGRYYRARVTASLSGYGGTYSGVHGGTYGTGYPQTGTVQSTTLDVQSVQGY
jgi:hypothetical protein